MGLKVDGKEAGKVGGEVGETLLICRHLSQDLPPLSPQPPLNFYPLSAAPFTG